MHIINEAMYPVHNVLYFYMYMYVTHFSIGVNFYTTVVTSVCLFTMFIGYSCVIIFTMCHADFSITVLRTITQR